MANSEVSISAFSCHSPGNGVEVPAFEPLYRTSDFRASVEPPMTSDQAVGCSDAFRMATIEHNCVVTATPTDGARPIYAAKAAITAAIEGGSAGAAGEMQVKLLVVSSPVKAVVSVIGNEKTREESRKRICVCKTTHRAPILRNGVKATASNAKGKGTMICIQLGGLFSITTLRLHQALDTVKRSNRRAERASETAQAVLLYWLTEVEAENGSSVPPPASVATGANTTQSNNGGGSKNKEHGVQRSRLQRTGTELLARSNRSGIPLSQRSKSYAVKGIAQLEAEMGTSFLDSIAKERRLTHASDEGKQASPPRSRGRRRLSVDDVKAHATEGAREKYRAAVEGGTVEGLREERPGSQAMNRPSTQQRRRASIQRLMYQADMK